MERFWLALGFLTRLPAPAVPATTMGRALPAFPLVGLLIGGILLITENIFQAWSPQVHAALVLMVWVAVTGALHLDGLADSADGWAGGQDRETTLAIMRDPRSGAVGVVVLVLVLLTKWTALSAGVPWQALIFAPALGRLAAAWLFLTTPYARREGLGSSFASDVPATELRLVALVTATALPLLAGFQGLWILLGGLFFFHIYRRFLVIRLGGTTGDTAGALVELTELLVLVGFAR